MPRKKKGMPEKHQGNLKESPLINLKNFTLKRITMAKELQLTEYKNAKKYYNIQRGEGGYLIRTMLSNQYKRNNELEKSKFYIHLM